MRKIIFILPIVITLSGCISYYMAPVPLRVIEHQPARSPGTATLVVFLPGNFMDPEEFAAEGFIDIVKKSKTPADTWAVDARLGYYIKRSLPERLMADVIAPAKKAGYGKIWLAGISMGGSGALWFAKENPDLIHGVILLAPFLGDKPVIREIQKAGGAMKWQPPMPLEKGDYQRAQWLWLKKYSSDGAGLPVIAVGFGDRDRFADANRLLAELLPPDRSLEIPGDHDWATWRELFTRMIEKGLLEK